MKYPFSGWPLLNELCVVPSCSIQRTRIGTIASRLRSGQLNWAKRKYDQNRFHKIEWLWLWLSDMSTVATDGWYRSCKNGKTNRKQGGLHGDNFCVSCRCKMQTIFFFYRKHFLSKIKKRKIATLIWTLTQFRCWVVPFQRIVPCKWFAIGDEHNWIPIHPHIRSIYLQ